VPQSSNTTVLQVLPSLHAGGVERGTVDVAAALVAAGWRAVVASAGGPMVREVERAGAIHITLPVDSKNPLVMRGNVRRLAAAIRAHKVDIVHARSRAPAWSAQAAAHATGAHFVTTFHGTYNAQNRFKRKYNAIMARGERVIAISEFIRDIAVDDYGAIPDHVRVIPRGVDLAAFDPTSVTPARIVQLAHAWKVPDGIPIVMLPGRLTRWKGQTVLIDALAKLGRRDLWCVLVGADQGREAYRRELIQRATRAGLGDTVRIVGHCTDMPAAYMMADVVVSASTDPEAFGRVAAEAQAMGRPVIATDHGGSRHTVVDGETGWLVQPGDPDALAQALDHALNLGGQERERLAERAVAHVRANFTKAAMCTATLAVYREVLGEAE
jgi:glycosyltransferase involved in cell wall biosynthesis